MVEESIGTQSASASVSGLHRTSETVEQDPGEATLAEYVRDALGQRIEYQDLGSSGPTVTTRYYHDGNNSVVEYDDKITAGISLRRYFVHGTQYIDERAVVHDFDFAQDFYYYLADLYTVDGLVNNRGHEVERYTYDVYGKPEITVVKIYDVNYDGTVNYLDRNLVSVHRGQDPCTVGPIFDVDGSGVIDDFDLSAIDMNTGVALATSPQSSIGNPYLFTGRTLDTIYDGTLPTPIHIVLQDNRNRSYDYEHGRWLQRDPLEYVDGMVLYEYALGASMLLVDPYGEDAVAEFFLGSGGKGVSTWDAMLSRDTLSWMTFGLVSPSNPADQARLDAAFREGVVSPTITAGEFAAMGPVGGARSVLIRSGLTGVVFGTGEFTRDLVVGQRVQSLGEFATITGVAAGGGLLLEGVFVVGGRAILALRCGNRSRLVALSNSEAAAMGIKVERSAGQFELNMLRGQEAEVLARALARGRGETILETQFQQGAVRRGFDFASYRHGPGGTQLYLNEVKGTAGRVSPSRFTSLGQGRGGRAVFDRNILQAEEAILKQVGDPALRRVLRTTLREGAPIRLMGPRGFRVTPNTVIRIEESTGRPLFVIDELVLP